MQRRAFLAVMGSVLTVGGAQLLGAEPTATPTATPERTSAEKVASEVDLKELVNRWNTAPYPQPTKEFRKGHVTPGTLDKAALQATPNGYVVKLRSNAPIPTPSVHNGRVFVSGGFHSREYFAFDAATGQLAWAIGLDDDGPSAAVCAEETVVFNTESCTIFAVDAKTGEQRWSWWLGDPLTSTPTIAGGHVFTSYPSREAHGPNEQNRAGNQNGLNQNLPLQNQVVPAKPALQVAAVAPGELIPTHVLACFDLKTGELKWQRWIDSDVMSAAIAVEGELYATTFAGTVYKFKQATGELISAKQSRATSAPVVVGQEVLFTRRSDNGASAPREALVKTDRATNVEQFAVNEKAAKYLDQKVQDQSGLKVQAAQLDAGNGFGGGAPLTANADAAAKNVGQSNVYSMQAFQGSRVLNYGRSNFSCMGDELVSIDLATGAKQWNIKLPGDLEKAGGFLASPPAAAGGCIFLATLQGEVLQIGAADGKLVQRHKIGSPVRFQPVIEGGRIYVGTDDGKLVCIDLKDTKFTGWCMWGGNAAHTGKHEDAAIVTK